MHKLACPKCHQTLQLEEKTYKCNQNHCYDIAKNQSLIKSR